MDRTQLTAAIKDLERNLSAQAVDRMSLARFKAGVSSLCSGLADPEDATYVIERADAFLADVGAKGRRTQRGAPRRQQSAGKPQ